MGLFGGLAAALRGALPSPPVPGPPLLYGFSPGSEILGMKQQMQQMQQMSQQEYLMHQHQLNAEAALRGMGGGGAIQGNPFIGNPPPSLPPIKLSDLEQMKLELDFFEKQDRKFCELSLTCPDDQAAYYLQTARETALEVAKLRSRIAVEERKQKQKAEAKKYILGPDGKPFSLEGRLAETIEAGRQVLEVT